MTLVVGMLVARSSLPFTLLGTLVGVSSCGMLATVDRREFAGFPGSRYSRPLMTELQKYDPSCGSCGPDYCGCSADAALREEEAYFEVSCECGRTDDVVVPCYHEEV